MALFGDATAPTGRTSLRVGVDFHLVDGKFQGSRTHILELFSRVIAISPDIEFFLFLDRPELLLNLSRVFQQSNVQAIRMPAGNPLKRLYWDLGRFSARYDLNIMHTQYVLPHVGRCKRAVTIHDVLFETHPQFFTMLFSARSRLFVRHAARNADHVFTVSEFSRAELCRLYGVKKDRISIAYNGVDYDRFATVADDDNAVLAKWGLEANQYLLSVGRLEPRKNQESLVLAYGLIEANVPPLILVGQRDYGFNNVFAAIRELGLTERVRVLENVDDRELPALYRHASVFAYPSFAEGFGMPVLEAMAAGTPVVTSNTTAISEIAGPEGAILVNPADVEEIAAALDTALSDQMLRTRLIAAGRERAQSFTWEKAAKIVRQHYFEIVR